MGGAPTGTKMQQSIGVGLSGTAKLAMVSHGLWHRMKVCPTRPLAKGRVERAFWEGGGGLGRP